MLRSLLAALLCMVPAAAHAEWHEATTGHFTVFADDSAERVGRFAAKLERFDKMLRVVNGVADHPVAPANRVTVYMVANQAEVERLSGRRNVAGFYIPRAGEAVAFVPRGQGKEAWWDLSGQAVLFHEYTHHFMLTSQADHVFPSWYVEGIAEFYATAIMREDGSVTLGQTPGHRGLGLVHGPRIPVATLLAAKPGLRQDDTFYGRGWLLTHYSMLTPAMGGKLAAYLQAINAGKPAAEAAQAFGDLGALDRAMETHMRRRTLPSVRFEADRLPIGEVKVRRLDAAEAAMMPARMRSKRGVDQKSAPAVLALARAAAAPYPNEPSAQVLLAEAEFDAGNLAEAGAAADRARARAPRLTDALVYKGRAEMAIAVRDKVTDPERWKAVRRWFIQAAAIDGDDPEPLMLFYQSFAAEGATPTRNAKDALLRAQELGGQDRGLRFLAGAMLVEDGNAARARTMLRPIAYSPHGGDMAEQASKIIAAIDGNDMTAARALLKKETEKAGED